ncbi:MAG: hypothetical protein IJ011_02295 [Clostridia bacterium]|nr:hypothetical protein [Clostridia bacterium]
MNTHNKATAELLSELYKNMKMGADSIVNISSKVTEGELRDELTRELDTYEEFAKKTSKLIYEGGDTPEEKNIMSKMASKVGMAMNTLTDSSESHIAQMMIEGSTMGITENRKLISKFEDQNVSPEAMMLARDSVKFMEDSVERLKKFL